MVYLKEVSAPHGPVELDLVRLPKKTRVQIRRAKPNDIERIYELITENVTLTVAPPSVMRFVMACNRNNIVAFMRHDELVGFHGMLMLTSPGLEALLMGEFAPYDPRPEHLACRLQRPAAVYQWLTVAPRMAAEGVLHVSCFLQHPFYRHANLYSRSITPSGQRIALALGFHPVPHSPTPGLHRYVRLANRTSIAAEPALLAA